MHNKFHQQTFINKPLSSMHIINKIGNLGHLAKNILQLVDYLLLQNKLPSPQVNDHSWENVNGAIKRDIPWATAWPLKKISHYFCVFSYS